MDKSCFNNNKSKPDGLADQCRACKAEYRRKRDRTEDGLILKIFHSQRHSSKVRGHEYGMYTRWEFSDWMYANGFKKLYDEWVESGYRTMEKPSVDRIDDSVGYVFGNIRIVKWRDNLKKAGYEQSRGIGVCGKSCKAVVAVNKSLDIVHESVSTHEAERVFKIDRAGHLDKFRSDKNGLMWFRKETYERLKEFLLTYNQ